MLVNAVQREALLRLAARLFEIAERERGRPAGMMGLEHVNGVGSLTYVAVDLARQRTGFAHPALAPPKQPQSPERREHVIGRRDLARQGERTRVVRGDLVGSP